MTAIVCQPCTCRAPETVDLTEAYVFKHSNSNGDFHSDSSRHLKRNLEQLGWSPVSIDLTKIPKSSPIHLQRSFWENPKPAILRFFDGKKKFPNASFYTSESGGECIEAKQSWEVRRCQNYTRNEQPEISILDDITISMHSVISTVNWTLGLPPSLLLQEDHNNKTYGCTCSPGSGPCNVDLLRVFHYDPVPDSGKEEKVFGSSEHTDWGTYTVVWQDSVGGLQTYCQSCRVWNDVEAPEQDGSTLRFVIHVGDATSLAIAKARQLSPQSSSSAATMHTFPSPKHRVLSPRKESRASLVYFVYPLPDESLESLATSLVSWSRSSQECGDNIGIPFENYFLLRDQSEDAGTKKVAKELFDSIYHVPMQQVFAEKWKQVQR